MPTYDYECAEHGVIEVNLPVNHEQPKCETCGALMKRKYTANPIHFKGDGFYSTGG